ncbi:MAG: alpha-1,4-glucan--maltose-1-phosphate maltosyltransferase [Acetobacteraceae bacterium]
MTDTAHITLGSVLPRVTKNATTPPPPSPRRVYTMDLMRSRHAPSAALIPRIKELGFDTLLLALPAGVGTADIEDPPPIAAAAAAAGLHVHLDLALDVARNTAPIVRRHPNWYRPIQHHAADPREAPPPPGLHRLDLPAADTGAFAAYWAATFSRWGESGVSGYRCKPNAAIAPGAWQAIIAASPEPHVSIWTPGLAEDDARRLPRGCFDLAYNSLAWWDFAAAWLRDELSRLAPIAPVANTVALPEVLDIGATPRQAAQRILDVASGSGFGLLLSMGFEFGVASDLTYPSYGADDWVRLRDNAALDLTGAIRQANRRLASRTPPPAAPEIMSSDGAPVAVLFEPPAQLTLANRHLVRSATCDLAGILPRMDGRMAGFTDAKGRPIAPAPILLDPGEVRILTGAPANPIVTAKPRDATRKQDASTARLAAAEPRVAIEAIEPAVDGGRFAVKRLAGERVTVAADIFADGHGKIAAALQWRAGDETDWRETAMRPEGNDRWSASFWLERVGRYVFRILAWPDRFATWLDEVTKKHAAGLDLKLELEEGKRLVEAIAAGNPGTLDSLVAALKASKPLDRFTLLTGEATAEMVARTDTRPGHTVGGEMAVDADRRAAEFASWYELFPRGQSDDPGRHGTFRDVIRRLPAIRDMGFDVLYFPPIHPIGVTNRKGRGNALTAGEGDPGSPYAIGSIEGGHDAIHSALGTIDDFRALRDAAADHGLELALDFAIQCSPDHPWLREHPEWFDWRPDGGLRYAENPPKKYEDIVNVDFHQPDSIPGLWLALRDVVAYWAAEGVRIFRVDNPHTKPFAFWEWLIADIRGSWPDALFLAEAFTRPKVMYRLGKLGFTQSYTYFTWRNEKREIEAYLRELTGSMRIEASEEITVGASAESATGFNVPDFFRPNFFVNTPDINPTFLQHSGRAGFLIRAALAATLSGLWGMLQGYEFCEAAAVPDREEYADSDKYEIRVRPLRAPGDIVDEITQLNAIRRANPALQSHRGLAFHHTSNDRVLWYRKANIDRTNVVLVAVSLDPFGPQWADVEVPVWEWGLGDNSALLVADLMRGGIEMWHGKYRTINLDPRTLPFGIWRAREIS